MESRFDALHTTGLTRLVGRKEEIELLLRRWSTAIVGEGQVVLLSGEAGIGKSRITVAMMEQVAAEPHTRLRYFNSPQHTDSALYPIAGQMERAAGLLHNDKPQAKLDKIDALLAQTSTSSQARVQGALGRTSPCHKLDAQSASFARRSGDHCRSGRDQRAGGGRECRDRGAH